MPPILPERPGVSEEEMKMWVNGTGSCADMFPGNEGVVGKDPEANIVFPPPVAKTDPKVPSIAPPK